MIMLPSATVMIFIWVWMKIFLVEWYIPGNLVTAAQKIQKMCSSKTRQMK